MLRISKCVDSIDGLIEVLLTPDEYQAIRELPPPPTCFICGKPSNWLTALGYESKYDESWICPKCQDEAIDLLKVKTGE